jgi:MFS family permease
MEVLVLARKSWSPWLMWGLGALCYLTALFHRMSLSVAGLTAQQRFSIDATGLAAFSVVQLVLYATLQVPVGAAADRFGPRRLLLAGMASMAAGSTVFALATAYPVAMIGRALIGAGDACLFVNVLRLAHNWFPGRRYALVAALTGMIGGLGQLIATAPLAALLTGFGWTTAFLAAGVVTAALLAVVGLMLRDGPEGAATPVSTGEPLRESLRARVAQPRHQARDVDPLHADGHVRLVHRRARPAVPGECAGAHARGGERVAERGGGRICPGQHRGRAGGVTPPMAAGAAGRRVGCLGFGVLGCARGRAGSAAAGRAGAGVVPHRRGRRGEHARVRPGAHGQPRSPGRDC